MLLFGRVRRNEGNSATLRPPAGGRTREDLTQQIGRDLLRAVRHSRPGLLASRFWSDQLIDWAMKDRAFKAQLFRFVDVFPTLTTPRQVHDYLLDHLGQPGVTLPPGFGAGLKAGGLAKGLLARTIAGRIEGLAGNFIAGADAAAALPVLEKRWSQGVGFSVDLLGEACLSDEEAASCRQRYLDLIDALEEPVRQWPENPVLDSDHLGPLPRTNVSIKISSLAARTDPIDFEGSLDRLFEAIRPILEAAGKRNVFINFDMEQHRLKELTLELFMRCCGAIDFPAGLALQSYLRSGEQDAERLIEWAKLSGRQVTVRLIKGAYWDYEVIHAEQMGWPVPVWTNKRETDACFERMAGRFVASTPRTAGEGGVKLALGSHNVRSVARTLALVAEQDLPESALELQLLFGMGEPLKAAAGRRRLRVREYVPLGEMIPGMAYLVRRLLENTSNESWLRAGFAENASDDDLLASPHQGGLPEGEAASRRDAGAAQRHRLSVAIAGLGDGRPFFNEPGRDFSQALQRERFAQALRLAEVPAAVADGTAQRAEQAAARAAAAFPSWSGRDAMARSAILVETASLMRDRRDELAGIVIGESGKTWREADADVCEAIDFCEYYARLAVRLLQPCRAGRFAGELNENSYRGRGVSAVISPWNFPLAICTGMTTAALVTGNCVLVKPSTQTPGIARVMCDILWQAGVPVDVLQFLPGRGSVVGSALVGDPRVAVIGFTGSKRVGLEILRTAGQTPGEQGFVKKIVCEMGGKNAIIVDESADLDEAVVGVRQSAFSYSGQKCSACSRVVVVRGVFDRFLKRLIESTRSLAIGDPKDPGTDIGPVIDENAAEKIRDYIELGKEEGTLELACRVPDGLEQRVGRPYVGPHIFSGIRPDHRLGQEEIFGPVLSVMRAGDFAEAIEIANTTSYKLTGGVFSRKPSHVEAARQRFAVGNLYVNRGITGAQVGRQPFGGFGLSGTGTKAGGPDYLLNFVEPRCCSENTIRHGFSPELM